MIIIINHRVDWFAIIGSFLTIRTLPGPAVVRSMNDTASAAVQVRSSSCVRTGTSAPLRHLTSSRRSTPTSRALCYPSNTPQRFLTLTLIGPVGQGKAKKDVRRGVIAVEIYVEIDHFCLAVSSFLNEQQKTPCCNVFDSRSSQNVQVYLHVYT